VIRKLVVLGFAAILLLGLAGCGGTGGSSPSTAQPAAQSGTGNWVTVTILSGTADKQGPVFALSGAPLQLTCKVLSTSGAVSLSVYTLLEGNSLADSQGTALGTPVLTMNGAGTKTITFARPANNYYLDVTSANCSWQVTLEERH
jgi:hypothetical protein